MITTHLAEVARLHAARLLGREDVRLLTDVVKRNHPVVVEELTPTQLSLGEVQRVLQSLLDEGVSIRDLVRIFEAISLRAAQTKELDALVDAARAALGPAIVASYLHEGAVHAISLDPRLEQRMLEVQRPAEGGSIIALDPDTGQQVLTQLDDLVRESENRGVPPGARVRTHAARRRTTVPATHPPVGAGARLHRADRCRRGALGRSDQLDARVARSSA